MDSVQQRERGSLPVRSFGVSAPKQVPEGARRRDLGVSGVENHADVFGDDGGLDAVVQLRERRHKGSTHQDDFDFSGKAEARGAAGKTDLQVCRQSHVNLLPVRSDSVEQEGVVQRAVPHRLKAVEGPGWEKMKYSHSYSS